MKYDHIFNSTLQTEEAAFTFDKENNAPICVFFENENISLKADHLGNAVFFNNDGEEILSAKTEYRHRFQLFACKVTQNDIILRFPTTIEIDHYPHCDGEYDRWSERRVNCMITCPIQRS